MLNTTNNAILTSLLLPSYKNNCSFFISNNTSTIDIHNPNSLEISEYFTENNYLYNNLTDEMINNCDIKCQNCSLDSQINNSCISCNIYEGYYPKYNDILENNSFIECYNFLEGYYLDNNTFKPCFYSCKECNNSGDVYNNNCLACYSNYTLKGSNYYEKCEYYYYINSSNYYSCTSNKSCPNWFKNLIEEKNQCIEKCDMDDLYKFEYNNKCYKSCPNNTYNKSKEYLCFDNIDKNETKGLLDECNIKDLFNNNAGQLNNSNISFNNIITNFKNEIINGSNCNLLSNINEGEEDLIIKNDNIVYQITSSDKQNINKKDNISNIILGKCEEILKNKYNINEKQSLLIFKIDYYQPDILVPIIRYEVYHPITKQKLDLSYCKNELINFNIPVSIDEDNLFKYDPNNEYYKDDCFPYTNEYGTDILINDRQNEFNDNNLSLCENNCTYNGYDNITKKSKCECQYKSKDIIISEIMNETNDFSYGFANKEESSNMISMKCVHTLFTKKGLIKNIGSYILLFTILLFIISGILFYKSGYILLEDDIKEAIEKRKSKTTN